MDFSSFQNHSRISRVVLSSPVPSWIFPELSQATRPDISSLVLVPAIREVTSSLVPSCLEKKSSGMQTSSTQRLRYRNVCFVWSGPLLSETAELSPIDNNPKVREKNISDNKFEYKGHFWHFLWIKVYNFQTSFNIERQVDWQVELV